jgi:hypothetical protein
MSVGALTTADSIFALLNQRSKGVWSTGSSGTGNIAASFALYLANFQAQTLGSLTGTTSGSAGSFAGLDAFFGSGNATTSPLSALTNSSSVDTLSATGRNSALFDPESAYKMMSFINNEDVDFKAQFSELSEMKSSIAGMQQDAASLGGITTATADDSIKSQLQTFASQYNDWVKRFDADMQSGGILAGTRAAQVSRSELDQSVENVFNGAMDGLHGMSDLGFSIDPVTKLATLDTAKLDSVLAGNRQGAVDTLQQFSASFAKAAQLLDSDGNFVPKQLDNLSRAIDYIDSNKSSLQAEFGLGDAAKPSGLVAQALAAYNRTYGVAASDLTAQA